jgi:adenine-specific DNA-methyltransferase
VPEKLRYRLGGLYCYFLGICHEWLAQSGVAAWLIPSEFMDVNYGTPIKKYLLDKVTLIRVHRFDPHDVQFGDALVSSAVVLFRNEAPPPGQKVHFSFGGMLSNPKTERYVSRTDITPGQKWTKVFDNGFSWKPSDGVRLGDLFDIKRGIATGANSYFILNREQADEKGIPDTFLTPILPSPRYLDNNEIGALPDGTPDIDRKLYLVNCSLPEEIVERESKELWRYIQEGVARGINNGYLCRNRWPWYAQEKREPAPLLCSYMGRISERGGPFRLILNRSNAIVPNVYLMLYPKRTLQRAIDKDPGLIAQVWEWLNDAIQAHVMQQSRVYGGGLHKVEPKELAALSIEGISTLLPWVREEPEVLLFK